MKYGIRNSHLTSIAPTGTISLLAGNVSSGLEPVFAFSYTRKIRNTDENDVTEVRIDDAAYRKYCEFVGKEKVDPKDLPDYFVHSGTVSPVEHLEIQAKLQQYVDSSISKTINVPGDYPFEDFKNQLFVIRTGCGVKCNARHLDAEIFGEIELARNTDIGADCTGLILR